VVFVSQYHWSLKCVQMRLPLLSLWALSNGCYIPLLSVSKDSIKILVLECSGTKQGFVPESTQTYRIRTFSIYQLEFVCIATWIVTDWDFQDVTTCSEEWCMYVQLIYSCQWTEYPLLSFLQLSKIGLIFQIP